MFQGEVLSTVGWKSPEAGDTIAALDNHKVIWLPISEHATATTPLITIRNALLNYTVSPDHEISVRHRVHNRNYHQYKAEDIAAALGRISKEKHGVVRWHHTTQAPPKEKRTVGGPRFHKYHAAAHALRAWGYLGSVTTEIIPSHPSFFQMGATDAALALAELEMWWPRSNKSPRHWTLESRYVDHIQTVFFFNNIFSTVIGNRVLAQLGTRKAATPIAPLLSSRTTVTYSTGVAHSIDVPRPFVRNEGFICAL